MHGLSHLEVIKSKAINVLFMYGWPVLYVYAIVLISMLIPILRWRSLRRSRVQPRESNE